MSYREVVAGAAGARPSRAVGLFLDQFMLPGEPVSAALKGTIKLMPAWLVVTPAVVMLLRDGMSTTLEAVATPAEGIGWQAEESWGDTKLHLQLGEYSVTLAQVNPRRLGSFLNQIEFLFSSLSDGFPVALAQPMAEIDAATTAAIAAAPLLDPDELHRMIVVDFSRILFDALNQPAELTFDLALLVFVTALARPDASDLGRRGTIDAAIASGVDVDIDDLGSTLSLREAGGDAAAAWRQVVAALGRAVTSTMTLLAPNSPYARSLLHASAVRLQELASTPIDLVKPAAVAPDVMARPAGPVGLELVETLERLQKLKESGALTASEYQQLKQQALQG